MSNDTKNAVRKFVKDMSKAPAPKQLAVGATAGWLAGYITMKVGKAAATMVGGSLLVLQIAHHKGMLGFSTLTTIITGGFFQCIE